MDILLAQADRAANQDIVHQLVQEFVGEWTADELCRAAQQHRICVAPVMTAKELGANEHLRSRRFFTKIDHPLAGELEYTAPGLLPSKVALASVVVLRC